MSKLRDQGKTEDDGGEGWLVSYADLMTLVACFFILMMAFANYDPVGFTKKTQEVSKHFNKDKYKSSATKLQYIQEEVALHPELKKLLKVTMNNGELQMTFSGSTIFAQGEHEMSSSAVYILDTLIDIIKSHDIDFRVIAEGHTTNDQSFEGSSFNSNWALSSARASEIISRFEYHGFNPKSLIPIGLADTKPLLPNEDNEGNPILENQKMNRRVTIKVLEAPKEIENIKLGLGVYFDE